MRPHYIQNILSGKRDAKPVLRLMGRHITGQVKMRVSHADIADAESSKGAVEVVLHDPEVAFTARAGAKLRILIEQNQITHGEAGGQGKVGTKAGREGVHQLAQQPAGEGIAAADYGKNTVGRGTDSVLDQRNCAYAFPGFGGRTPENVGAPEVEGLHQAVGQGGGKQTELIQDMMDMRLRNATEAGQPPFGELAPAHAHAGDVDDALLQILEIHLSPRREYALRN